MAPGATATALDDWGQALASALPAEGLKVPRPLRLALTAGWSLAESAGLPAAAYILAAWLDGRDAGLVAVSTVWFLSVLRRLGPRLRFAPSPSQATADSA